MRRGRAAVTCEHDAGEREEGREDVGKHPELRGEDDEESKRLLVDTRKLCENRTKPYLKIGRILWNLELGWRESNSGGKIKGKTDNRRGKQLSGYTL